MPRDAPEELGLLSTDVEGEELLDELALAATYVELTIPALPFAGQLAGYAKMQAALVQLELSVTCKTNHHANRYDCLLRLMHLP